jgi:plasmid maintenance system killer protein
MKNEENLLLDAEIRKCLEVFFTNKQLEIIFKKSKGEKMSKTEKEYLSRKMYILKALADDRTLNAAKQILSYF